jgi:hypothetical protein
MSNSELGEISFQEVIFRQQLKIGELSGQIFTATGPDWQKNAHNYWFSVQALWFMAYPYLLKNQASVKAGEAIVQEATELFEKLEGENKKGLKGLTERSKQDYIKLTVDTANRLYAVVQVELYNAGLLREKAIPATVIGEGGTIVSDAGVRYSDNSETTTQGE